MNPSRPGVIVTGSSGLIGQPTCRALADAGYEVFGFDLADALEQSKSHSHVRDVDCDLTDDQSIRAALEEVRKGCDGKLASVVHMAAYYDFSGEDSELYEKVTVNGTDRLLNALSDFDLEQFLFTSTMLVHKPCAVGEHISEDDPLQAKWPYPQSKIETERLIRDGHPDVHSVLLRISGVYNEDGIQPTLVQQIKRIYEKDFQSLFFPGDPRTGQSFVHVEDVVDAIVRTVEKRRDIEAKTPILIGEPDPPSYEQLQDKIGCLVHGKEWSTLYVPKSLAKAGAAVTDTVSGGDSFIKPFMVAMADDHYALDISRAEQLLGWKPKHCILDTLPAMIKRLQDDPETWYQKNGLE